MANMTLDITADARVATQCEHPDGLVGSFLYQGAVRTPTGTSPRFPDLAALFAWCANDRSDVMPGWGGWKQHGNGLMAPYRHVSRRD